MLEIELFNLLEGTADAAFAVSDQGEICSWNKAAEKLFGYGAAEAVGNTCHNLLKGRGSAGAEFPGTCCRMMSSAARRSESPNSDLQVKVRSGRRVWVNVSTLVFENSRSHRR